jgi:hypothetical protein
MNEQAERNELPERKELINEKRDYRFMPHLCGAMGEQWNCLHYDGSDTGEPCGHYDSSGSAEDTCIRYLTGP